MVKDLFNNSCLRKSAETALKVFQVIWLWCLPEAPGNGSFTFLGLESSSSPRAVRHQPRTSPRRPCREKGRRGQRDRIHAAVVCVCAKGERQFVPINVGFKGVKWVDEWLCVDRCVCGKVAEGSLLSFYSSGDKRNDMQSAESKLFLLCF